MVLLSLAQSCVLNGINPLEYFADVLMRMNDPPADLTELLPGNWKPSPEEKNSPIS
jgi:transposase